MRHSTHSLKYRILTFLSFCSFLVGLDALIISPLSPKIAEASHFSPELGGLLVTAYSLMYGLSAPLLGPFSDRWGRKRMIQLGLLLFGIGTALTAFGGTLGVLLLYRAIAGLGGAMVMPSVYAYVGDLFAYEERGKAIGIVMASMSGASVLGIPIGAYLAAYISWQYIFLIVGLLAVVLIIPVYRLFPAEGAKQRLEKGKQTSLFGPFYSIFKNRSVAFALLCTFLWWAGFQGLFSNMGLFYFRYYSLSVDHIGLLFALAGFGSMLGNMIGGRLSDRIGKKRVVVAACVLSAFWVALLPQLTFYLLAAAAVHFIWAFATGLGQSSLTSLISELNPGARGTVLSFNSSATYLGMTAASSISVGVLQTGGFGMVGLLCALSILLVLPISKLLHSQKVLRDVLP